MLPALCKTVFLSNLCQSWKARDMDRRSPTLMDMRPCGHFFALVVDLRQARTEIVSAPQVSGQDSGSRIKIQVKMRVSCLSEDRGRDQRANRTA
jgi:hypothetical protein